MVGKKKKLNEKIIVYYGSLAILTMRASVKPGVGILTHYKLIPDFDTYAGVMIGYDISGITLSPAHSIIPRTGTSFIFIGDVAEIRYEV